MIKYVIIFNDQRWWHVENEKWHPVDKCHLHKYMCMYWYHVVCSWRIDNVYPWFMIYCIYVLHRIHIIIANTFSLFYVPTFMCQKKIKDSVSRPTWPRWWRSGAKLPLLLRIRDNFRIECWEEGKRAEFTWMSHLN